MNASDENYPSWLDTTPHYSEVVPVAPHAPQSINQGYSGTHPSGLPWCQTGGQSVNPSNLSLSAWTSLPADYNNSNPSLINGPSLISPVLATSRPRTTGGDHSFQDHRERLATTATIASSKPPRPLAPVPLPPVPACARNTNITASQSDPTSSLLSSISTLAVNNAADSPTFAFTHQSPAAYGPITSPTGASQASPSFPGETTHAHIPLITPPDDVQSPKVTDSLQVVARGNTPVLPARGLKLPWTVTYSPQFGAASTNLGTTLAVSATASTFSEAYSPRQLSWAASTLARPSPPSTAVSGITGWSNAVPAFSPQASSLLWSSPSPSSGYFQQAMSAPGAPDAAMQRPEWESTEVQDTSSAGQDAADDSARSVLSRSNSFTSDSQEGPQGVAEATYGGRPTHDQGQDPSADARSGELRRDWKFGSDGRKHVPPPLFQSKSFTYGTTSNPPPAHYVPETSWQPAGVVTPTSIGRGAFADFQMPPPEQTYIYHAQPNTPRQFSPQEGLNAYRTSAPVVRHNEYDPTRAPTFGFYVPHSADQAGVSIPTLVRLPLGSRAPNGHGYEDGSSGSRNEPLMSVSQYSAYLQEMRQTQESYHSQQPPAVATSHLRSQSFGQSIQRQQSMNNMGPPVPQHNVFSYVHPQAPGGMTNSPHHSDVSLDSSHQKALSVGSRSSVESLTGASNNYGRGGPQQAGYEEQQGIRYTTDANVKQSEFIKRECFTCQSRDPPSWRRSILDESRILCNRCGIFERSHGFARTPEMMGKPIAKPKNKIAPGRFKRKQSSIMPDYEQHVPDNLVMNDRGMGNHYRQDSYQSSGYTNSGTGSSFSPVTPWSSNGSWSGKTPNSATFNKKRTRANTGPSNDPAMNAQLESMMHDAKQHPSSHVRHDSLRGMSISYPPPQPGHDSKPSIRLAHTARAPSWTGNNSLDEYKYGGAH